MNGTSVVRAWASRSPAGIFGIGSNFTLITWCWQRRRLQVRRQFQVWQTPRMGMLPARMVCSIGWVLGSKLPCTRYVSGDRHSWEAFWQGGNLKSTATLRRKMSHARIFRRRVAGGRWGSPTDRRLFRYKVARDGLNIEGRKLFWRKVSRAGWVSNQGNWWKRNYRRTRSPPRLSGGDTIRDSTPNALPERGIIIGQ